MAISVKSMIVNDGKLLIVKRADTNSYKPGIWEIPGGRIVENEDLILGLFREIKEETGLDIRVNREINVRDFKRDDKQEIEMHIFLCNAISDSIILSKEHSKYLWIELTKSKSKLTPFFHQEVDLLLDLENERWP